MMSKKMSKRKQCGANWKDITNHRFGKLVALYRVESPDGNSVWMCRCDCGNEKAVSRPQLRSGTMSCGCLIGGWKNKSATVLPNGEGAIRGFLKTYKGAARKRGHEWSITDNEFRVLIRSNCYYCRCRPSIEKQTSKFSEVLFFNGIDRLDNEKGYTLDNSVPCCSKCNHAKCDMSEKEFAAWAFRLGKNIIYRKKVKISDGDLIKYARRDREKLTAEQIRENRNKKARERVARIKLSHTPSVSVGFKVEPISISGQDSTFRDPLEVEGEAWYQAEIEAGRIDFGLGV